MLVYTGSPEQSGVSLGPYRLNVIVPPALAVASDSVATSSTASPIAAEVAAVAISVVFFTTVKHSLSLSVWLVAE